MQLPEAFKALDEKQKRILIGVLIFLATFFICYKLIYKNAVNKAAYYKNRTREVIAQNKLREQLHNLDGIKKAYESLIIHTEDIDSFKNELSKLALSSGAKVVSIRSVRKPGGGNYIIFSIVIELECNYHQLGRLISKIENAQPYIKIESVKLGGLETMRARGWRRGPRMPEIQPEGAATANVNLVVETYSLRE